MILVPIIFLYIVIVVCGIGCIIEVAADEDTPDDIAVARIANMVLFPLFLIIWIPKALIALFSIFLKSNFKRG